MKKYRVFSLLLACALLLTALAPISAYAADAPEVTAKHAILMDASHNEVLYEKAGREKAYPASITKVMTALLTVEAVDRGELTLDQPVTASASAMEGLHAQGSTANIKPGEVLTVRDLLYCLLLPSANEAANILAETVAGDKVSFVGMMNRRAQELGCTGTHFSNAHGLHADDHYTTAYDICLFTVEAMKHDIIRTIVSTASYEMPATNLSGPRQFYNTNGLISNWHYMGYVYDKAIGVKTGTTDEAGHCLVSAAVDGDEYLVCAVLGAENVKNGDSVDRRQFSESRALLKWGFKNFKYTTISKGDAPVAQVEVTLSQETDSVMVKPVGEFSRVLPVDLDVNEIETEVALFQKSVEAPIKAGQVLGTMTLSYNGEEFGSLDLVAVNSVERSELLYRKAQIIKFFSRTETKVLLGLVLAVIVVLVLRFAVFHKRRRPTGGRRQSRYSGRRRRY